MKNLLTAILLLSCLSLRAQTLIVDAPIKIVSDHLQVDLSNLATTAALSATTSIANNAKVTADGAVSINNSQASAIASLQNQINNIVIPPSAGIPKPIDVTGNYIVTDTCHMRTLVVKCSGCTISFPVNTVGLKTFIQSSSGTVYLSAKGTSLVGSSTRTITVNSRPVMVDYYTGSLINIR